MVSFSQRKWTTRTELLLLMAGVLCVGYCALVEVQARASKRSGDVIEVSEEAERVGPATRVAFAAGERTPTRDGSVMGRLEIPQIGISVPILSNYSDDSLRRGVGHIPKTAMPGGLGTMGLAGHRDMYLRPLRNIKSKMDIRVIDKTGVYHYLVDSTEVVSPEQVDVLDTTSRPELTLITCYPFYYVGTAPKRFIVHAHLLSALADDAK
jgi:sortase A